MAYNTNFDNTKYGLCDRCNEPLIPRWFEDKEFYPGTATPTGRTRTAVAYLYCPSCLKRYCVDDSFDGVWR